MRCPEQPPIAFAEVAAGQETGPARAQLQAGQTGLCGEAAASL